MSPNRQFGFFWFATASSLILLSPLGGHFQKWLPLCTFKQWVGLPCPACGTTRSALALAAFDPLAALAVNPLVTLAWVVLVLGGLAAGFLALTGRRVPEPPSRLPGWARAGIVAAVLANWAYLVAHGT